MEESRSDYDELIAPIESRMMLTVWRVLGDADEAEDALQDALVRIWRTLSRIRAASNSHALILKICADSAYDRLRKRIRHRKRHQRVPAETASREPSPSTREEARETCSQIRDAIGHLSRNQAVAIVMRIVQRESYATIAAVLNCGEATARKHGARGRTHLQRLLGDFS